MPEMDFDALMREAIFYGEKGKFHTFPNPAVGAVLVKDGSIVAHGWHKGPGLPHAEIECLGNAAEKGIDTTGTTMVVTLEPCVHFGKTPPCTDALLNAGISTLVYGTRDPNPAACGGAEKLKASGVHVTGPVLEQECRDLIADFIVWQTTSRPYIILKLASTLDGKIATRTGHSKWISSRNSRHKVHNLREAIGACGGAILIGGGTFRADNPELTARTESAQKQPLACIITSRLPKADADFHLLRKRPEETIFFASPAVTASNASEALRKLGCRIFALAPSLQGGSNFQMLFKTLREELECPYILCEGGGRLALSLLESNYVDEFHLHIAPLILGDNDAKSLFSGRSPLSMEDALHMRFCKAGLWSEDAHLLLRPAQE